MRLVVRVGRVGCGAGFDPGSHFPLLAVEEAGPRLKAGVAGTGQVDERRPGSAALIARRSPGVAVLQRAISSSVRQQPSHRSSSVRTQTPTHGLAVSAGSGGISSITRW